MARPVQFRRLSTAPPKIRAFLPEGSLDATGPPSILRIEELEAVRLVDVEGLDQRVAAGRMGISRPTFGRILMKARRAIAGALTEGRKLCIEGGVHHYENEGRLSCPYCDHTQPTTSGLHMTVRCRHCCRPVQMYTLSQSTQEEKMDLMNAKVAVTSDDGTNVTSHFGRAPFFVVLTFRGGSVVDREQRSKIAPHNTQGHQEGHQHAHGHNHSQMIEPIKDCQAVVARGMGDGAFVHLTEAGLTTILTELHTVQEVETAVQQGTLLHQPQRVHAHGHQG